MTEFEIFTFALRDDKIPKKSEKWGLYTLPDKDKIVSLDTSIRTEDAERGSSNGLIDHINPYCREEGPVSSNVYKPRKIGRVIIPLFSI